MKFSENWLREWVDPQISTKELAHQLTMSGLEVESIQPVAPALDKIVVGQVTSLEAHPDADKLRVCAVDVGQAKPLQIVCGAANVQKGGHYPVALKGAKLPDGMKIKKSKLRGVESEGMLCSAKELHLAESADGLLSLPTNAPVGTAISEYLQLNDQSIELGLTPNRGDCLSVMGVAREVGVLNRVEVNQQTLNMPSAVISDQVAINITAKHACTHYVGSIIKNVNSTTQSPIWLQEKLRRSGLRSLHPIVDVTNYVLLEMGQPMHAFDLDKLNGGIQVRMAKKGEKIDLLDGQKVSISDNTLVIADDKGPVALAGIMGGNDSAVTDETKNILLESAYFDPIQIASRARQYGLHTDSSHRFERGVDPELQQRAMARAVRLILEITGGEIGPMNEVKTSEHSPIRLPVTLKYSSIKRYLGIEIERQTVEDILTRLGMSLSAIDEQSWSVVIPSYRFDIALEVDLIEEIARIHGYGQIPDSVPDVPGVIQEQPEGKVEVDTLKRMLVTRGYQEAITYSFVDPGLLALLDPDGEPIKLSNPISADMSVMRTNLWVGLINVARYNMNRQQNQIRLFEVGQKFVPTGKNIQQENVLAGLISGTVIPEQWGEATRALDFYDIKNDVETLLNPTHTLSQIRFEAAQHPALHPGQSARIMSTVQDEKPKTIGMIGTLHPAIQEKLGLSQPIYLFELQIDILTKQLLPKFIEVPKFPTIRRDLAIIVDDDINAQRISDCIINNSPSILIGIQLFDVYRGEGIENHKKSMAYALTLQDIERTLTDNEVDTVLSEIMSILNKELGATMRN